jgi:hypothetical protein
MIHGIYYGVPCSNCYFSISFIKAQYILVLICGYTFIISMVIVSMMSYAKKYPELI